MEATGGASPAAAATTAPAKPRENKPMNPHESLGIIPNPDGRTFARRPPRFPPRPPSPAGELVVLSPTFAAMVTSVDLPLNPSHPTSLRLFLSPLSDQPLPLILYFHPGGFVNFSAATPPLHAACAALAATIPAAVASVDYRLAPEHRLPAAFHDAADAIAWAGSTAAAAALGFNPSEVFLMGDSSGGTIALRTALEHLKISAGGGGELPLAGLILNQPYFGGRERTPSEKKYADDPIVPLQDNDLMWELALPLGADRAHAYCDVASLVADYSEEIRRLPPCLVLGYRRDPLVDRERMLVEILQRAAVDVEARLDQEGSHGSDLLDQSKAAEMMAGVKSFVSRVLGGRRQLAPS